MTKEIKCPIPPALEGTVGGLIRNKEEWWKNVTSDHQRIGYEDIIPLINRKIDEAKSRMRIEATAAMFPEWFSDFDESNCTWGE